MKDWLDEELEREGIQRRRSENSRRREEMIFSAAGTDGFPFFNRDSEDARSLRQEHQQEHEAMNRQGNLSDFQKPKHPSMNTRQKRSTAAGRVGALIVLIVILNIIAGLFSLFEY